MQRQRQEKRENGPTSLCERMRTMSRPKRPTRTQAIVDGMAAIMDGVRATPPKKGGGRYSRDPKHPCAPTARYRHDFDSQIFGPCDRSRMCRR